MSQPKAVIFTATGATEVHGKTARRRRRRCQHCHEWFTPARATAKFCSNGCRGKAYRARHKPRKRAAPIILTHHICSHCGKSFQARSGHEHVYCSGSCKTLAYRVRREALIHAIAATTRMPVNIAAEVVEKHGMKHAAAVSQRLGIVYDPMTKTWTIGQLSAK